MYSADGPETCLGFLPCTLQDNSHNCAMCFGGVKKFDMVFCFLGA